jgi:hypothetical protein
VGEYGESVFKAIKLRVVSLDSEQFWTQKAGIYLPCRVPDLAAGLSDVKGDDFAHNDRR